MELGFYRDIYEGFAFTVYFFGTNSGYIEDRRRFNASQAFGVSRSKGVKTK